MRNVIYKTVVLKAPPEALFEMYVDPVMHQAITGLPVTIGGEAGAEFSAFDGALTGVMLQVAKPRLIVQTWRSSAFTADDPDSILILSFHTQGEHGRIELVHLDVPDQDYEQVKIGWREKYFEPWREFLAN
ncbi:Activator of Hsp90 ATPase homolog 1-like protein [Collimonas sp. OK307]|uniref:SRPBCC domain-containing protein n=1 Tax=Collimonas sp. OK307 TaxID=1801620 RepID=UPI0008E6102C|nr:SRPBCC domain-containing protein [Collimonas sp. OK307]SFI28523.1 Activator of Hsp90 ATPase homolog 1-like protein [Collimonas sp. OK307]